MPGITPENETGKMNQSIETSAILSLEEGPLPAIMATLHAVDPLPLVGETWPASDLEALLVGLERDERLHSQIRAHVLLNTFEFETLVKPLAKSISSDTRGALPETVTLTHTALQKLSLPSLLFLSPCSDCSFHGCI